MDKLVEPLRQPRRRSLCSHCLLLRQLINAVQKYFDPSRRSDGSQRPKVV